MPLDRGSGEAPQLAPHPAAVVRERLALGRRHEERRPLARRAPFVVGRGVVVEEVPVERRVRLVRRLAHHDLASDLPVARRVRRVVVDHRRGEPVFRRRARRHPVRRNHRHRLAVGDELLHRLAGVVQVGRPVRPVSDDVVVVRHLDEVEVHGAHLRHALEEIVRERLPPKAPGVGRAALPRLEHVPFERELWRDHELLVDPRQFAGAPQSGRPGRLRTERCSGEERPGRDARGRLEEVAPRGIGIPMSAGSAHSHRLVGQDYARCFRTAS